MSQNTSKANHCAKAQSKTQCSECEELFIPVNQYSKQCGDCYALTLEYARDCDTCTSGKILPTEEEDISECYKCRGTKPGATDMRQCTQCKKLTIYPKAPPNVKVCFGCADANKAGGGSKWAAASNFTGPCRTPKCKGTVDAKWKPMCTPCFIASKK